MRHCEEYYTCDRCGAKIEKVPSCEQWTHFFYRRRPMKIKTETISPQEYPRACDLNCAQVESMEMVVSYNTETKEYDLCPKCRKDFERFMKNENGV